MKFRLISLICFLTIAVSFASMLAINSSAATSGGITYEFNKYNFNAADSVGTTNFIGTHTYHASVSPVSDFFDANGNYNVVYKGANNIYAAKFNSSMQLTGTVALQKQYPVFGGAICDSSGNYYVVSGQKDTNGSGQTITLCISKYDSNGKLKGNILYKGSDTWDSSWGTKDPFNAGNCSLIIKNNILVCTYAREMYNGYQSNHVLYINPETMKKLDMTAPYCSHSFDQQVIPTQSGSFLFVDHGDEFDRGFVVSKLTKNSSGKWRVDKFVPFHFREGSNREFGYNETYAQLGGIAETTTGYVLAGASENTLSYSIAPTTANYCGHNESRNLFVQVFKKNFESYSNSDKFVSAGGVRNATGKRPSNPGTTLGLKAGTVDYGVKWLTAYSNDFYAANPKVVITSDDKIVLLWERMKYGSKSDEYVSTYFMVLTNKGNVLMNPVELPSVRLTAFEAPVYRNGSIYWTTSTGLSSILTVNKLYIKTGSQIAAVTKTATTVPPTKAVTEKPKTVTTTSVKTTISSKVKEKSDSVIKPAVAVKVSKTAVKCATPSNVKAAKASATSIKIKWGAVKGAAGYVIYRYNPAAKAYAKIKTTSTVSFTDTSLKPGQTYYYKVRAYLKIDGTNVYSGYSSTASYKIAAVNQAAVPISVPVQKSGSGTTAKKIAAVFLALQANLFLLPKSKRKAV